MDRDELFDATTRQRQQLLGTLDSLTRSEWDADSLCDGWRVRDVVGHLVGSLQVSTGRLALGAIRARGFDRHADELARSLGERDPKWLVAALRIFADKRVAFPVIGPVASLIDVYVHTRDIERPLLRPSLLDHDVLCTLLDHLCVPKRLGVVLVGATKGAATRGDRSRLGPR